MLLPALMLQAGIGMVFQNALSPTPLLKTFSLVYNR